MEFATLNTAHSRLQVDDSLSVCSEATSLNDRRKYIQISKKLVS